MVTLVLLVGAAASGLFAVYDSRIYVRFDFYQVAMGTLGSWMPVVVLPVLAGAVACVVAHRRRLVGTLAVVATPWLIVATVHAQKGSVEALSAVLLVLVVAVIAGVGAVHQHVLAPRSPPGSG